MKTKSQIEEEERREEADRQARQASEPPAITITTSGHLSAGIGSGLGIDLSTGGLTMGIGESGVSIDL